MTISRLIGIALVAGLVGLGPAGAQAQKTVKIATEGAYEPWNFTGPGGQLQGFEIDLANDLCRRMNVKCEISAQDWDGLIPALQAGKFDAIMAGMSITDEREKAISFSRAYANAPNGFVVEKSSALAKMPLTGERFDLGRDEAAAMRAIEQIKPALKGKTIGVQGSTTHATFAERYLKGTAEIREYKSTEAHDLDLAAGRVDAILADSTALQGTLKKPEFKGYAMVGPNFNGGVLGRGVGAGVRKADTELKGQFDKAVQEAVADGTVKKLSEKWFGLDITPRS
jgi:octopine/nopaline transport system substrate-binding protein